MTERNTLFCSSILFLAGIVCLLIENAFYQKTNDIGVLIESLFMPIGVVCIFFGGTGLLFVFIRAMLSTQKIAVNCWIRLYWPTANRHTCGHCLR